MITEEDYNKAIETIKEYHKQEYEKLPYTLGMIQFIDGRRFMEARKMKDSGKVFAMFRNVPDHMKGGDKFQLLEVDEPLIANTFKEKVPEIRMKIFKE